MRMAFWTAALTALVACGDSATMMSDMATPSSGGGDMAKTSSGGDMASSTTGSSCTYPKMTAAPTIDKASFARGDTVHVTIPVDANAKSVIVLINKYDPSNPNVTGPATLVGKGAADTGGQSSVTVTLATDMSAVATGDCTVNVNVYPLDMAGLDANTNPYIANTNYYEDPKYSSTNYTAMRNYCYFKGGPTDAGGFADSGIPALHVTVQ